MNNIIDSHYKLKYWFSIAGLALLGILALYASELVSDENILGKIMENIGIAFFFTGIASIVQEYILKNTLVNLILSKLKLKEDIEKTGVVSVVLNIAEIDYSSMFRGAQNNIDIFHVYGRTWTNTYMEDIKERLLNSNCKVRIVLLNPESLFVPALDEIFVDKNVKNEIESVSKTWKRLYLEVEQEKQDNCQSEIELYYHSGYPTNSLYRIDNKMVVIQNKMAKGRSKKPPGIICEKTDNTDLYDIYLSEIDELATEDTKVDWSNIEL